METGSPAWRVTTQARGMDATLWKPLEEQRPSGSPVSSRRGSGEHAARVSTCAGRHASRKPSSQPSQGQSPFQSQKRIRHHTPVTGYGKQSEWVLYTFNTAAPTTLAHRLWKVVILKLSNSGEITCSRCKSPGARGLSERSSMPLLGCSARWGGGHALATGSLPQGSGGSGHWPHLTRAPALWASRRQDSVS